jgi:hypothetical protein
MNVAIGSVLIGSFLYCAIAFILMESDMRKWPILGRAVWVVLELAVFFTLIIKF